MPLPSVPCPGRTTSYRSSPVFASTMRCPPFGCSEYVPKMISGEPSLLRSATVTSDANVFGTPFAKSYRQSRVPSAPIA